MAYYETIYNTATPALDIMTNLQTWMPANGYTFVETYTSGTNISDVYKSPGTSNSFGTDFYIGFNRTSTTVASVGVMVFEQWDAVNKKAIKYAPSTGGSSTTPAGDGTINDAGVFLNVTTSAASCYKNTVIATAASVSATIYLNITVNRLIWGHSTTTPYAGYAGLYDPFTSGGFPLISLTTGFSAATIPTYTSYGSLTREPWISAATTNFAVYTGSVSYGYYYAWPATISTGPQAANNKTGYYPTTLIAIQGVKNTSVAGLYGTLKDIVYNNQGGVNGTGGDTLAITVGATTYNYVKPATSTTYGPCYWIPKQ
jgi:hypothetical protein